MSEKIDRVAIAIREKIATRHRGLPKGGWDGLMKLAAIAAIEVFEAMQDEEMRKQMAGFSQETLAEFKRMAETDTGSVT